MAAELERIAPTINDEAIEYTKLLTAGCNLHVLRATYSKWMVRSIEKLDKKPVDKGMLDVAAASLNPVGIGGADLGGPVGKLAEIVAPFVRLAQKWPTVTTDAYFHMALEYAIHMNEPIVTAAREMSEDALQRRATPSFSVWTKPPPLPAPPGAPPPASTIVDDVRQQIADVGNFLKRPVPRCPGSPFLDIAFQEVKEDAKQDDTDRPGLEARSLELPKLTTRLVAAALAKHGIDTAKLGGFGEYLRDVITEGSRVVADFLHAVYGVVTTLTASETIDKEHMLAAGRTHLVDKLVYLALDKFKVLSFLRQASTFNDFTISPEALAARGLEALESKLEPALRAIGPILEFAMYELAEDLTAARAWCGDGDAPPAPASAKAARESANFTVETYLAILPATYAKLVRHLVFFLVHTILGLFTKNVLNPVLSAVGLPGVSNDPKSNDPKSAGPLGAASALAGGPLGLVGSNLGKAGELVEKVTKVLRDVQAIGKAAGRGLERVKDLQNGKYGTGPDSDNDNAYHSISDGIDDIKNAHGDGATKLLGGGNATVGPKAPGDGYPFKKRVKTAVGKPLTDDDVTVAKAIAAKHKVSWKDAADTAAEKAVGA